MYFKSRFDQDTIWCDANSFDLGVKKGICFTNIIIYRVLLDSWMNSFTSSGHSIITVSITASPLTTKIGDGVELSAGLNSSSSVVFRRTNKPLAFVSMAGMAGAYSVVPVGTGESLECAWPWSDDQSCTFFIDKERLDN